MLTSVKNLKEGDFILYSERLHLIKSIKNMEKCYEIILRGIYLPHTIVNVVLSPKSEMFRIEPECSKYKIVNIVDKDTFELESEKAKEKITMSIPDYSTKIKSKIDDRKSVHLEICKYNGEYGVYSVNI